MDISVVASPLSPSAKGFIGPLKIDPRAESVELYLEHPIGAVLTICVDGVETGKHEVVGSDGECPTMQCFKVPKGARTVSVDGDRVMFSTGPTC